MTTPTLLTFFAWEGGLSGRLGRCSGGDVAGGALLPQGGMTDHKAHAPPLLASVRSTLPYVFQAVAAIIVHFRGGGLTLRGASFHAAATPSPYP